MPLWCEHTFVPLRSIGLIEHDHQSVPRHTRGTYTIRHRPRTHLSVGADQSHSFWQSRNPASSHKIIKPCHHRGRTKATKERESNALNERCSFNMERRRIKYRRTTRGGRLDGGMIEGIRIWEDCMARWDSSPTYTEC